MKRPALLLLCTLLPVVSLFAAQEWRLIGITGQQANATDLDPQGGFLYPDNTLYEINESNGASNKLFRTTWVPDSQSIGYCPTNNLIYHTAGAGAYRDDPLRVGNEQGGPDIPGLAFQDNYYIETVNLETRAMSAVLNANPCPNPDTTLPCFGKPAPIPAWVLPAYRRDSSQIESTNRLRDTNEYSAVRGMAWSTNRNLFYVTDGEGIFKLTPGGDSTFLARPGFTNDANALDECKAIAFVTVTNVTKLLVGHRNGAGEFGYIMEVDPKTGANLGELALTYPPGGGEPVDGFGGLLGLAQHPVTGIVYGLRQTTDPFARELVTINLVSGATTLVGAVGLHLTTMVFVPVNAPLPLQVQSVTRTGNNLTINWSSGTPPYQVQRRATLSGGTWVNEGLTTTTNSATVTITGNEGYFRILGQ